MNSELLLAITVTLLSGGLITAIATGRSAGSAIKKNSADALLTYQKIAELASASELASQERLRVAQDKCDSVVETLEIKARTMQDKHNSIVELFEKEAKARSIENSKIRQVLASWSVGIKMLHDQMVEKEIVARWRPNAEDIKFLDA